MTAPIVVERALEKLPARYGLIRKGPYFLIRCPDHKDGREKHQSFRINATSDTRHPVGSGHCFTCGAHYRTWKLLFERLNGGPPTTDNSDVEDAILYDPTKGMEKALLEDEDDIHEAEPDLKNAKPWDDRSWRGIPARTMRAVGAQLVWSPLFGTRAFLPVYVKGKLRGGIFANLKKKGKLNYFNTNGRWAESYLFLIDYVAKKFSKHGIIVLVEGPRDALRLIALGIPAVALLGTGHAQNEKKFNLLSNLDIDTVILAFDGDEAGRTAAKKANALLKDEYKVFKYKMKDGQDICTLPAKKLYRFGKLVSKKARKPIKLCSDFLQEQPAPQ